MRQLVYEVSIGQRFLAGPLSQKVKSVEVLNILRHGRRDVSVICRVRFKDPSSRPDDLFDDDNAEVRMLEQEKRGVFTLFVRRRLPNPPKGLDPLSVYLSTPWRVESGTGRATMIGSEKQIGGMLRALEESGIRYRIISLADPKFSSGSLLGLLTDRQKEVLNVALSSGYYDIPRRTSSDELARRLGVRNATFVAHRRKAERRLMTEILKLG